MRACLAGTRLSPAAGGRSWPGSRCWRSLAGAPSAPLGGAPKRHSRRVFRPAHGRKPSASTPTWLEPLSPPLALSGGGVEPAGSPPTVSQQAARDAYAKLPLAFVKNAGQTDEQVRYYALGQGFGFYFTPEKAVLSFTKDKRGAALHLAPLAAKARLVAGHLAPSKVNYLVGAEGHTNLPTYHELATASSGRASTWSSAARAASSSTSSRWRRGPTPPDPARLPGAGGLALGGRATAHQDAARDAGRLAPRSYQRVGGSACRSRAAMRSKRAQALRLRTWRRLRPQPAARDRPGTRLLDVLGRTGPDRATDRGRSTRQRLRHRRDPCRRTSRPPPGRSTTVRSRFPDAFVTKLNPTGSALVYSTFLGGGGPDSGNAIAVDGSGSAYVTGLTGSSDFPMSSDAPDTTHSGLDAFVTKFKPDGSALHFSSYLSRRCVR